MAVWGGCLSSHMSRDAESSRQQKQDVQGEWGVWGQGQLVSVASQTTRGAMSDGAVGTEPQSTSQACFEYEPCLNAVGSHKVLLAGVTVRSVLHGGHFDCRVWIGGWVRLEAQILFGR